MVLGTSQSNNNRRSDRRTTTPQRVQSAAEQMRNTGSFRGYVPQQTGGYDPRNTGNRLSQNTGDIRQRTSPQQVYPYQPSAQYAVSQSFQGGQRGFGTPSAQAAPKKKKRTGLKIFIAVLAIALIAGGAYAGVQISKDVAEKKLISDRVTPYDHLYCPGVYVDGIHLGGMTPEQAMNSVQSQINQRHDAWKVRLVYEGSVAADIDTETLNMSVDKNEIYNVLNDAWIQGHTGTQAERYSQMEALEKTPYSAFTAKPSGNTGEIDRILSELKGQIDRPMINAAVTTFDPARAYPFLFTEEQSGYTLDVEPIKEQLYQMASTLVSGTITLQPEIIQPQITVEDLKKHYALRATATTPISTSSDDNRNNNIRRCFQLISGTEIKPGKNFSFNKIVGERTVENGFFPATEYISDEHVIGIGGGACQASTTVYQAAVCAGLEIISRRPHSDSVSYAAYGTDATVYMGGKQIDLVFKNNTEDSIFITAEVLTDPKNRNRLMTKVCIYGTDLGDVRYTLETETVETLPSIMDVVYVKDKESASKAKDGCIVNSYRMTYVGDVWTGREFLFKDTYKPKPEKIYDPSR